MSAWTIGTGRGGAVEAAAGSGGTANLSEFVDKVVQWIPSEIVAFYLAAITFLSDPPSKGRPSVLLWLIAAALTAALVLIAALKAKRTVLNLILRVGLGTAAFFIWSAVVPLSGWGAFSWAAENPKWLVVGGAAAGLVFTAFADWATGGN